MKKTFYPIIAAVLVIFLFEKIVASFFLNTPEQNIFQLGFGFGPYIQSLHDTGELKSCHGDKCIYSSKMPVLPLFYAGLSAISTQALTIAIIKNTVISIITFLAITALLKKRMEIGFFNPLIWIILLLIPTISPILVKHAAAIQYEEGVLVELVLLWTLSFLLSVLLDNTEKHLDHPLKLFCLILGCLLFLIKESMLFFFIASICLAFFSGSKDTTRVMLLCAVLVVGWGVRNWITTDRFSVMSSWNGENMYRGANSVAYKIYPKTNLDRLFDSTQLILGDGTALPNQPMPTWFNPLFKNEWEWNDHYKTLAYDWIFTHPTEMIRLTLTKTYNLFISLDKSPATASNDARQVKMGQLERIITTSWLTLGRLAEIVMMGLIYYLLKLKDGKARKIVIAVVVCNLCYAAPCIIGFNYERHIAVYFVIVFVCIAIMLDYLSIRYYWRYGNNG
jgi:hypothetical protein